MSENKRKNRQDLIREAFKGQNKVKDLMSFEAGAKFADYHPYWRKDLPKPIKNDSDGLPKLYLCQILALDMTFGYRYSYRIGFITEDGKWNIEQYNPMNKVVRYLEIFGNENESQLTKDIEENEDYFLGSLKKSIKKDEENK